jgi:hypothetical protein
MLSGMADDFIGAPSEAWHELMRDVRLLRIFAWLAMSLVILLVLTLMEKNVLSGWGDLFRRVTADG